MQLLALLALLCAVASVNAVNMVKFKAYTGASCGGSPTAEILFAPAGKCVSYGGSVSYAINCGSVSQYNTAACTGAAQTQGFSGCQSAQGATTSVIVECQDISDVYGLNFPLLGTGNCSANDLGTPQFTFYFQNNACTNWGYGTVSSSFQMSVTATEYTVAYYMTASCSGVAAYSFTGSLATGCASTVTTGSGRVLGANDQYAGVKLNVATNGASFAGVSAMAAALVAAVAAMVAVN